MAIVSNAAMNTGVHVSLQIRVFLFSRYMLRSGIAKSYGCSIFNFLKTSVLLRDALLIHASAWVTVLCVCVCVCVCVCDRLFSHVQLFVASWTVTHQAPLPMEFSRQEYWSRVPFSIPGDPPDPGIQPTSLASPALAGRFFTTRKYSENYATWKNKPVPRGYILCDFACMTFCKW